MKMLLVPLMAFALAGPAVATVQEPAPALITTTGYAAATALMTHGGSGSCTTAEFQRRLYACIQTKCSGPPTGPNPNECPRRCEAEVQAQCNAG